MSTKELDHYKATYTKYVEEVAKLHNAHLTYTYRLGRETGFVVRKHIKMIIKLQKELQKSSLAAFVEFRSNNRVRRESSKKNSEMMKQKIRDGTVKVKQKKNEQHNNPNASNV